MKLRVLGSGNYSSVYNSASYLIDDEILVDMPNGTYKTLRREGITPNEVNHILITHFHGDHYFDIPFYLIHKLKNEFRDNTYIYCSREGNKKVKKLLKLGFPNSIDELKEKTNIIFLNDNIFQINDYTIKRIPVIHGRMKPAWGYCFESDGKKVFFTGDTSYCESLREMARVCDEVISECSRLEGNEAHLGIDNINALASSNPTCIFYLSHLDDEVREAIKETKNVKVLNDGDILEL